MRSINEITGEIVDSAVRLHVKLGPGLLESVFENVLVRSLERKGLKVERQKSISFGYEGMCFPNSFRVDIIVEDRVLVELRSLKSLALVHHKQLLTYLRIMDIRVGLMLNFGAATMREGMHRIVNNYNEDEASSHKL